LLSTSVCYLSPAGESIIKFASELGRIQRILPSSFFNGEKEEFCKLFVIKKTTLGGEAPKFRCRTFFAIICSFCYLIEIIDLLYFFGFCHNQASQFLTSSPRRVATKQTGGVFYGST